MAKGFKRHACIHSGEGGGGKPGGALRKRAYSAALNRDGRHWFLAPGPYLEVYHAPRVVAALLHDGERHVRKENCVHQRQ